MLGNPENVPLATAMQQTQEILKEMNLPPGYAPVFSGQAKTLAETGYYAMVALALSFIFMYLILAAQFESWTQPIAILMSLPVTIPFGLLSLVMLAFADGHLRDVRAVHAHRDREEERHPPGRRHEPAPRQGHDSCTRRSSRRTTRGSGRS